MAAEEKPVREFLDAVGSSPDLWRALDLRILAISIRSEWHNLLTRCYLSSATPDSVTRVTNLPSTRDVLCRQFVLPATDLPRIIGEVETGALDVGRLQILYRAIRASKAPVSTSPMILGRSVAGN